jgi:hypothetical protein
MNGGKAVIMPIRMNPVLMLVVAVLALAFASVMWLVFVRPAREASAVGIITGKTIQGQRTVTRRQAGARREQWSEQKILVPGGYLLEIELQAPTVEHVQFVAPQNNGERFRVGQQVRVWYVMRGMPGFAKRVFVSRIEPTS